MKRVFATGISQESNSFNPLMSTYEDFIIYRDSRFLEMEGIKALFSAGVQVSASIWARAVPGGTLKLEDFIRLADEMLKPLEDDEEGFDGVFLPMHGALDVEHIGSGEAFILAKVREIVGPEVPISVALDMHANITYSLVNNCNIIYGFRTAPHIDRDDTHVRAAELLVEAINKGVLPKTYIVRIPLIMPGENMMTVSGMGKEIINFLPEIEQEDNVWCASYFVGMAWVDAPRNGAAIIVTGEGDMSDGMKKADELARFVWDSRNKFEYQGLAMSPEDTVHFVKAHQFDGPVIVSDSADNVTAGAAGDNAFMLSLFLGQGIEKALFAAIVDPVAVKCLSKMEEGDSVDIEIGGALDLSSEKLFLSSATIKKITINTEDKAPGFLEEDKTNSCVLSYKGIDILLFGKRKPVFSEETLNEHGLKLSDYNILIVKQGYLSPELSALAKHSVMALTLGNCSQKLDRLNYKKLRRPVYPLDAFEW